MYASISLCTHSNSSVSDYEYIIKNIRNDSMASRLVSRGPVAGSSRSVPQKNDAFYYTILGGKKRVFSVDKSASYMTAEREAVIGG